MYPYQICVHNAPHVRHYISLSSPVWQKLRENIVLTNKFLLPLFVCYRVNLKFPTGRLNQASALLFSLEIEEVLQCNIKINI